MEEKHLSPEELLLSIQFCKGYNGTTTCCGCPNAIPETEDKYGMCKCRFDVHDEMIRILEEIIRNHASA